MPGNGLLIMKILVPTRYTTNLLARFLLMSTDIPTLLFMVNNMLKKLEDKHNQVEMTASMDDFVQTEEKQQQPFFIIFSKYPPTGDVGLKV